MRPYQHLSRVYDEGWSGFAFKYIELIREVLDERGLKSARVLDLACGTGTLAIELAKLGHTVQGIDISPEMIEIARAKSAGFPRVSFDLQNMRDFQVKGKFDLITCAFDAINYLREPDDLKKMLGGIYKALRSHSFFIFDSNTHHFFLSYNKYYHEGKLDGRRIIQRTSYDMTKKENTVEFTFPDGTKEIHKQRPYDLAKLEPLLHEAGLSLIYQFSGFAKKPIDAQTERIFCITEKRDR
jgi:SAM-dependent methyltransferase